MGPSSDMKRCAAFWILLFVIATLFAHTRVNEIEAHVLSESLHFGKDSFGRSCIELVLVGAFESIKVIIPMGLFSLGLSFFIVLIISFSNDLSRYWMRTFLDTLSSLPGFLMALALGVFFPNSQLTLVFASFFMIFPWLTRYLESQLQSIMARDFILASFALGSHKLEIFKKHVFPELSRSLIAILPFLLTRLLLVETSLTFLGLGRAPEHETWGRLLFQGRDYLIEAPWILILTGAPLCMTLFSLHLLNHSDRI